MGHTRGHSLGLAGCGFWGKLVLRDLLELGCDVHVVARSQESIDRARQGGAASIVGTVDDLPDVDGVVVATPASTHAEVSERALARGVPVFVEKPLTDDAESAERLAATADGRLFVMDKWRYHPAVEEIARIARSGELGQVVGLRTRRVEWGQRLPDVDALWHLAPHDLAICLEVLGEIPPARHAVGHIEDGRCQELIGTLGDGPWFALEVSHARRPRARELQLVCTEGVAWMPDSYADRLMVAPAERIGAEPEQRRIATELPLLTELRTFLEHLEGGPPPRSSAREGAEIARRIAQLRELAAAPA